jgi:hypothetical protein
MPLRLLTAYDGATTRGRIESMAGGPLWTLQEDKFLTEHYSKLGRKACAEKLNRPVNGVKGRAYALGIQADTEWKKDDDDLLIANYAGVGCKGCAKLLPRRSSDSIRNRAGFLGLTNDKRHRITQEERDIIRLTYPQRGGRKKCAELLPHLSPCAISHHAERLGVLQRSVEQWTHEENEFLKRNFANKGTGWCAKQLRGRTPLAVTAQARKLGLAPDPSGEHFKEWQARAAASKRGRPKPGFRELVSRLRAEGKIPSPVHTPEWRSKQAETMRKWHHQHGNPNKGKKLSDEIKQKMSAASRRRWDDAEFRARMLTPERRETRAKNSREYWHRSGRANENAYSRCSGGCRADLEGKYFRSGWEANYARILNLQVERGEISRWEYEPDTFEFPVTDRPRSYTPDFKVWELSGRHRYDEIKGWMDQRSLIKHRRMEEFHPNVRIRIIDQKVYVRLQAVFSPIIAEWEFYSSRYVAKRKAVQTSRA